MNKEKACNCESCEFDEQVPAVPWQELGDGLIMLAVMLGMLALYIWG